MTRRAAKRQIDASALLANRDLLAAVLPLFGEYERRKKHPFYTYEPDSHPDRDQLGFHQSRAMTRMVDGGNQSGKSRCGAQEIAWWLAESHPYQPTPPAPRVYVISAQYRTLQEGIWKHLQNLIPEWIIQEEGCNVPGWKVPTYVKTKNGGQVDFISGQGMEEARRKIQAAEVDLVVIDEEVSQVLYEEALMRLLAGGRREGSGRIVVLATLVRGEEWCIDLEERAEEGDPEVHLTRLSTYRARDAGHVSARVVAEVEATLPDDLRDVRLKGLTRRLEGKVYPEFDLKTHVIKPFEIPKHWTRYAALDPGWRTFGGLFVAVGPDGHYVIYREFYLHGRHYRDVAAAYFAAAGYHFNEESQWWEATNDSDRIQQIWIDPKSFGHYETGEMKIGNLFVSDEIKLYVQPALNDVEAGIEKCRGSLLPGLDGIPRMRVFNTCVNFISEIRGYRRKKDARDPSKDEKKASPIKRKDHLMDCWKYMELGGLYYYAPDETISGRQPQTLLPPALPASFPLKHTMERDWQRIMDRQKARIVGESEQPAHASGIGDLY